MNLNQLTNYQLYEIIQNEKLDKLIRTAANNEFNFRKLTKEEIQEIISQHDSTFQPDKDEPLGLKYKIVALVIPFFWVIHVLMTSRYLARGQKRKWNEYWLFFCIGLLIWIIAVVLIGKYLIKAD
jgi:hypothetical protein